MGQRIRIAGRDFALPRSRAARVALGLTLVIGGVLGFLPVLGFWMVPLGLIILSTDFAIVRRFRRRSEIWFGRKVVPWWRAKRQGAGRPRGSAHPLP